jgi:ferredoxin-NADP reductase/MOSC domain-containing protein YiiM
MTGTATLISVNVGLPKDVPWHGKTVHTGIFKSPVAGPVMVRRLNLDGDGQGDTAGHGGEQRAVFVYQLRSYEHWERYFGQDQRYFGKDDREYGQFGENFTVDGLPDDEVCIGDRYRIGEAEFEVTQPRVTCYRVGMRLGQPQLPALLVSHHRPGFYLRVITEGRVQAGDEIVRTRTGPGALSVSDTDALLYLPGHDPALLRRALDIPALSPGWQGSFRDLLADATSPAGSGATPAAGSDVGPVVDPAPAWAGFRPLRVTRITPESSTVSSILLDDPAGSPLPAARAGQYLTFRVTGAGDPAPVRSYSLSSAPGDAAYRISVKHEPHGVASSYLDTVLQVGATLDVAAPRGDFVLDGEAGPALLVSAGIGVTPVLAMLHDLVAQPSPREVWWIHAAREPADDALTAEAHALLGVLPNAHEHVFYSATDGRLSKDKLEQLGLPAGAAAYVCGPAGFMADMQDALTVLGVDPARIHTELFGTLPPLNPGLTGQPHRAPHPPGGPPGTGPQITFARSGLSVPFDTSQRSVLDFADACDVPTRWSCRAGVCHTCVTPLLSGDIAYAPEPLEPPAAAQVLICCARPRTDLVLDL